jgi:glycerophosphoryl diester phosphodiesterase
MSFSWLKPSNSPLVIAHRGSSAIAPENTIAAFQRAIKDSADAVELDIHLSKDGELAVIHDDRIDRTTTGTGYVKKITLSEIQKYDAGSWFDQKYSGEIIPSLTDILSLCKGKIGINIEIKSERSDAKISIIVKQCFDELSKYNNQTDILISSFDKRILEEIREIDTKITLGLLYDPFYKMIKNPVRLAVDLKVNYLVISNRFTSKRIVKSAHQNGLIVGTFTVNTEPQLHKVIESGVDAIITNDPSKTKKMLERINKKSPDLGAL